MKDLFFDPPEATGGKWKCKLCEGALTWRGSNSGYSAFVQHMKGSHSSTWRRDLDELKSNNARNGNLDGYVRRTVSDKAINLFNWIDWVVFEDLPFSAVENPRMRKCSTRARSRQCLSVQKACKADECPLQRMQISPPQPRSEEIVLYG